METIQKNLTELSDQIKKHHLDGEVSYKSDHSNMIRAGRSQISLNVTETRELYSIELYKNKKMITGSAINKNEASAMIDDLSKKIDHMPEISFLTPIEPLNGTNKKNDHFDPSLENINSQIMVDIYKKADELFIKKDKHNHISGSFSSGSYSYGIINTKTKEPLYHKGSDFNGEIVVQINSHDKKEIQKLMVGETMNDLDLNFQELENLYEYTTTTPYKKLSEGKYDVILSAEAMGELCAYFLWISSGESKEYGQSYLNDQRKVGDQLFGKNFTIADAPSTHPLFKRPFGQNGFRHTDRHLLKNGVLVDLTYADKMTCDRFNKKMNSCSQGEYNLMVEGGTGPNDQSAMIKSCKTPTIFINFLHYLNFTNTTKAEITGTSRFGTFLIENGKVTHNLEKVRLLDNFFNLFSNIEWLSSKAVNISATSSYGFRNPYALNVPKFVKIKNVSLS